MHLLRSMVLSWPIVGTMVRKGILNGYMCEMCQCNYNQKDKKGGMGKNWR